MKYSVSHMSCINLQIEHYRKLDEGVWDQAWEILHSDGWKLCWGKDTTTGCVYSKSYKEWGKIYRLEVQINKIFYFKFHKMILVCQSFVF